MGEIGTQAVRKFSVSIRRHLASQQRQPGDHPDANMLVGFAERSLSRGEHEALLAHLAECPECREVVALSSGVRAEEAPSRDFVNRGARRWRWMPAAAAVVCAVSATVWGPSVFKRTPAGPAATKPIVASGAR